jgi:tetratricopeptide (TPR) repeat protein
MVSQTNESWEPSMDDPEQLLKILQQNLLILQEREAKYGAEAPVSLLNQIDDYKEAIAFTELAVKGKLSPTDLVEELRPLHLDLAGGGTQITIQGDEVVGGDKIVIGDVSNSTLAVGERSVAAGRGGIAISGNVGGNLVISVGHTQVAISRLMQLAAIVAAVGVLILVGYLVGYDLYRAGQPRQTAPGHFGVAVVPFDIDPSVGPEAGTANEVADILATIIAGEPEKLESVINKSLLQVLAPADLDYQMFGGATDSERKDKAEALAERHQATIVMYGAIRKDNQAIWIKPEFYVREKDYNLTLVEAVGGHYQLGPEIAVANLNDWPSRRRVAAILAGRFRALVYIASGLNLLTNNLYPGATLAFSRALTEATETDPIIGEAAWANPDVIYLMLGNVALLKPTPELEEAGQNFQQATEASPQNARAWSGLGSVYYKRAIAGMQDTDYGSIDDTLLNDARDSYDYALAMERQHPSLAYVDLKANLGLGQVYYTKGLRALQAGEAGGDFMGQASHKFQEVIQAYDDTGPQGQFRLALVAAQAHGFRGYIHKLAHEYQAAVSDFRQALDLLWPEKSTSSVQAKIDEYTDEIAAICPKLTLAGQTLPADCTRPDQPGPTENK